MNKTQEKLAEAKALLTPKTWGKGDECDISHGNKLCPFTALQKVGADIGSPAQNVFRSIMKGPITIWNDAYERTLAEVHAAFDRAIELAAS